MKISMVSESDKKAEFLLTGASPAFANMIRRYAMSQLPVFAVDSISVYENNAALFDEYVSNRIGLVPLKMASGYKPGDEVMFTLEASGPGTVYSRELRSVEEKIKVANGNLPLLRLLEGQNLRLEAKAHIGIGRQHAKYQTGLAAYSMEGEDKFHFKVESFMQYPASELLVRAAKLAEERCDEFEEQLSQIHKKVKE
jgi:DNA-directed RNA polymerase subunit D